MRPPARLHSRCQAIATRLRCRITQASTGRSRVSNQPSTLVSSMHLTSLSEVAPTALLLLSFLLVGGTAWPGRWVPAIWLHLQTAVQYTRARLPFTVRHITVTRPWMLPMRPKKKNRHRAIRCPPRPPSPFVGGCV